MIIEESGRNWSLPIPAGPPRLLDDLVPGDAYWILWMPDGKSLLYTVGNDMFRVNRDGTARKRLLSSQFGFYSSPHVSPDGKRVCWVVKGSPPNESTDLWEATVELGEPHLVFPEFKGEIEYGDWTANGKLFFFIRRVHNEASLWVTRDEQRFYSRQRPPVLLYAGPKELIGPVSSRDSKEIYAIGSEPRGELSVYDPNHKQFIPYLGGISACYISFSPDRQWIAYVSFPEGTLWKSRLDGSEKMQLTDKPTGVVNPRWSPDGKLIVFMDVLASEHPGIFYVPAEGGRARLLVSGESAPGDPTWSPDSKSIIYSEGNWYTPKRKVMLLDLGSMKSEAIPGSDGLWSSRWSPDGKYIVAHTFGPDADQKMMLYSFATRKWRPLPSGRRQGWEAWSHDTKYVYSYDQETGSISRVNIETEKVETVADLHGVLWTAYLMRSFGWFDLTPDDQVMILRNTGSDEIYAFELEY